MLLWLVGPKFSGLANFWTGDCCCLRGEERVRESSSGLFVSSAAISLQSLEREAEKFRGGVNSPFNLKGKFSLCSVRDSASLS